MEVPKLAIWGLMLESIDILGLVRLALIHPGLPTTRPPTRSLAWATTAEAWAAREAASLGKAAVRPRSRRT